MAKNKTTETGQDVNEFVYKVADETKRDDSFRLIEIFRSLTGVDPKMWGPTIVGFGLYHYKYASGHEGDAPIAAFSPRKDAIVLYLYPVFPKREEFLKKLGKHKVGKSCVYIKKLEDIDVAVMKRMVEASIKQAKKEYP
jgi:hypothetical protein